MKIKVEIDFGNIVCDSDTLQSILMEYFDCDGMITVNGAEQADKTNALELFKKLPHLDYLYGVKTDWKYAPTLYHFDGAWHVTWIECEEGDSIKDFEAETPEEAIKKAFDWCVELKLIEK